MNLYGTGACVQRKTSATENKQPKRSGTLYFKTDTATQHLQQNSGVIEIPEFGAMHWIAYAPK